MSKTISFKGQVPIGEQDRIRLRTNNGKTGYRITKFKIMSSAPGTGPQELIGKITKIKDTNISTTVDFTDSDLLAVAFNSTYSSQVINTEMIIFDIEKFNQDIFVNITDASGSTVPCNYYIELEAMNLSDLETTMLTLQSIRQITSQ